MVSITCPLSDGEFLRSNKSDARPFLKWAGGKNQLIVEFNRRLPKSVIATGVIENYVEPFVGGGAMFFFLKRNYVVQKAILIDINRELILSYKVIQKNPSQLLKLLSEIESHYLSMDEERRQAFYYNVRERYNKNINGFDYDNYNEKWIERASKLIFLNKTCFNGLFRQNKKGEFNVPFGRYKKPKICDFNNILEVHNALENTEIIRGDFTIAKEFIGKQSFIYFDPPYRPLNSTSSFTSYDKEGFDEKDQIRLAQFFKKMHKRGAFLMLSNSDPKNYDNNDNFFEKLYSSKEFVVERITAKRYINCDSSKRGNINELIIRNY